MELCGYGYSCGSIELEANYRSNIFKNRNNSMPHAKCRHCVIRCSGAFHLQNDISEFTYIDTICLYRKSEVDFVFDVGS